MTTHLISIDPGKLSGFVILDITNTLTDDSTPDILESAEKEQMITCYDVHHLLSADNDINYRVVCEDFIITTQTGKKKDTRYSLEIIGALRYLTGMYHVPFTLQRPSEAKSFVSNERLTSMDLYVKGGEGHMRDAMRHAVYNLCFHLDRTPKGLLLS